MTTLRDGTVVNESIDAVHVTLAADVPAVFRCGPRVVTCITIHHWGSLGQRIADVVGYLSTDNPRSSSAHAVIQAGEAWALVNPDNAAWQAGNAEGNTVSIGLECHPEATDADYVTVAAYVAMLRETYGDIPLVPHNHWVGTECPGIWDLTRLDALARNGGNPAAPAPVEVAATPVAAPASNKPWHADSELHWVVELGDTLSKIQAYYNGPSVDQIASYNGITDINQINVGESVFIPGPLVWDIEAPDTLETVANYYGVDADWLAHVNGLPDRNAEIYIGNQLKII